VPSLNGLAKDRHALARSAIQVRLARHQGAAHARQSSSSGVIDRAQGMISAPDAMMMLCPR
jgi:hypothetical protein